MSTVYRYTRGARRAEGNPVKTKNSRAHTIPGPVFSTLVRDPDGRLRNRTRKESRDLVQRSNQRVGIESNGVMPSHKAGEHEEAIAHLRLRPLTAPRGPARNTLRRYRKGEAAWADVVRAMREAEAKRKAAES